MRLFYKPDCPFWEKFDVSGTIFFDSNEHAPWLKPKNSVTVEDDDQRLIEFEDQLSDDLRPVFHVLITQVGNSVAPFTGKAGLLKTKTADEAKKTITIGEHSHYVEIPARVSSQSMSDDEGESERDSSEPRSSDDPMFYNDSLAMANRKINEVTHFPDPLGRSPAQLAAAGAPQIHQEQVSESMSEDYRNSSDEEYSEDLGADEGYESEA
jgi:hypothetical protein